MYVSENNKVILMNTYNNWEKGIETDLKSAEINYLVYSCSFRKTYYFWDRLGSTKSYLFLYAQAMVKLLEA